MRPPSLTALGLLLLLASGCQNEPRHAPVSARTMERLTRHAEPKPVFLRRLAAVDAGVRAALPRSPVQVPFAVQANTPVIQATGADGRPMSMMLDTGAARLVLGARTAANTGVPTVNAWEIQATMIGVVGREAGLVGMAGPLAIGDWRLPAWPCFVRTFETSGRSIAYPENILGLDLPARYCSYLTVDYRQRQAVFGFRSAYRPQSAQHSSAPFQLREGVAFITLKSGGLSWDAVVDTGSFNGIEINERIARQLGVQDQGKVIEGLVLLAVGGTVTSDQARLRTITLPSVQLLGGRYEKTPVDISPGIARVGSGFLRDYRVTFDFQQKKIWLEW